MAKKKSVLKPRRNFDDYCLGFNDGFRAAIRELQCIRPADAFIRQDEEDTEKLIEAIGLNDNV